MLERAYCQHRAHDNCVDVHRRGEWAHSAHGRFHSEVMNAFSKRLKSARAAAGFETAKEFAEALGVEENRYRHWERGSAQPDLAMLTRITRLLKIEPNDLFPLAYKRKDQGNSGGSALAG